MYTALLGCLTTPGLDGMRFALFLFNLSVLSLGPENLSASQAKWADGEDALSAVWAGQSVTPEVAASLRRLQVSLDWAGCQPSSACEAPGQVRTLSIA
jgi:hypothetical protein